MMKITDEIRKEVENYLEVEDDLSYPDELYSFYYRCMIAGMHYADADRYAILNTLFDYDIGMENARAIDGWMYEHDEEIYELNATSERDKKTVALAVKELGLNLDFSNWLKKNYTEYKFFEPVLDVTDEELWKIARKKAIEEYEEEYGDWEEADKYEREDWVFSKYEEFKEVIK